MKETIRTGLVQTVSCTKCGAVFAGCLEPHCYTDKDWQKDVRKYAGKGYKIEMVETCKLGACTCGKQNESLNQTNLFI